MHALSLLLDSIRNAPIPEREAAILAARDLWVDWPLVDVPCGGAIIRAAQDVFAIGTVDAPMRIPLTPRSAQLVADELGMSLITAKMSDSIWKAARAKLFPHPIPPDAEMMSVARFEAHNALIEHARIVERRDGHEGLIAGHKKDVVLTTRIAHERKVALYGWHRRPSGVPIQPLQLPHEDTYVDYSHGIRLVGAMCRIEGERDEFHVEDVLEGTLFAHHLSDEGPIPIARYRT